MSAACITAADLQKMTQRKGDLLRDLCLNPSLDKLMAQVDKGCMFMPKEMQLKPPWVAAMSQKSQSMRTVNDAMFFVFALLVACPKYELWVTSQCNEAIMRKFMVVLREGFDALLKGRAPGGHKAESIGQREFTGVVHFVMCMKERYMSI